MPAKNFKRYRTIHDKMILRRGQGASLEELCTACKIQKSQLKANLKYMREELNAPIKYQRSTKTYVYTEEYEFSNDLMLSRSEYNKLKLAFETLAQYKHIPAYKDFEGVFDKIEKSFQYKIPREKRTYISFEKSPLIKGSEYIETFIEAIRLNKMVEFEYQTYLQGQKLSHQVQPYTIKEINARWYVIGFLPAQNSITTFALDRILKPPTILNTFFDIPASFNIEKHYQYTYGVAVMRDKPIEKIHLEFSKKKALYFTSKPFHPYVIVEEKEDGSLIVEMELRVNYELIRKVAGLGNGVKVISPISFNESVINYLQNAINQYDD